MLTVRQLCLGPLPGKGIVAEWERIDLLEGTMDWNSFFRDCRRQDVGTARGWGLFRGSFLRSGAAPERQGGVLVAFVGERPKEEELLGKMVGAMKFAPGEAVVIFSDRPTQCFKEILSVSPRMIVAMGASTMNLLLGRRERLSLVHGKVFDCIIQVKGACGRFPLLPIFHPNILSINPGMKRAAWIDLQKVFPLVGRDFVRY